MIVQKQPSIAFSTYLALASLAIGTLLLIVHLVFPYTIQIMVLGFFYLVFAIFVNGLVFLNLAYQFIVYPFKRQITAIRILILLSNIPIAMLYFYIIFHATF